MPRCPHCDQELPADLPTGAELRRWRLAARVTQRELARQLGVTNTFLCHIERGDMAVPVSMPRRYREALGLEQAAAREREREGRETRGRKEQE